MTGGFWIAKEGATKEDLRALCDAITEETQVETSLEGAYRWIVFLSSKVKAGRPVPSRYFGVFSDGALKTRGLAHRRRDTPLYVKEVREEMLGILSQACTLDDLCEKQGEALKLLELRIAALERGEVDIKRLIVEQVLSRDIEEYAVSTRAAIAARKPRESRRPLPLEDTLAIAEKCGAPHPTDPGTKRPVVMATDLLVTSRRAGGESIAIS